MMETKLEQADSTASSWSSQRQLRIQLWNPSCAQVKPEHLCELLNQKWMTGDHETLQKSICVNSVRIVYLLQDALVCVIQ
jgi:hypothetical protein